MSVQNDTKMKENKNSWSVIIIFVSLLYWKWNRPETVIIETVALASCELVLFETLLWYILAWGWSLKTLIKITNWSMTCMIIKSFKRICISFSYHFLLQIVWLLRKWHLAVITRYNKFHYFLHSVYSKWDLLLQHFHGYSRIVIKPEIL